MHEHIRLHKQSVKATEIFCGLLWALESLWQISCEAAPVKDEHMVRMATRLEAPRNLTGQHMASVPSHVPGTFPFFDV